MPALGPVVVVCTANICRSPMAAALLRHALAAEEEPLRSLPVVSAGVSARGGDRVTDYSVIALKKVGIDISGHVSQPLTQAMLDEASAVFCMTEAHRMMILATAEPTPPRVHLFREFMAPDGNREIADPFGGPLRVYEASRDEMVEAVPSIVEYLRKLAKAASA